MIFAKEIACRVGLKAILYPMDLSFQPHNFYTLLGANGAGKSTLLHLLSGSRQSSSGLVKLNDKTFHEHSILELAKQRAFLNQHNEVAQGYTVRDVLEMGRFPYNETKTQKINLIESFAYKYGLNGFLEIEIQNLSGGEQQRVQLIRTLLQLENREYKGKKWLFLDEPLNNLDLKYQREILDAATDFVRKGEGGVIAVMHDLNLSFSYSDEVILLKNGKLQAFGDKSLLLNETLLEDVFDLNLNVHQAGNRIFIDWNEAVEVSKI